MRAFLNAAKVRQAQSERTSPSREISRILNGGVEREQELKMKKLEEDRQKKEQMRQKKINKMAFNNNERREAWIQSVQNDPEFIEKYQRGNIPIIHPDQHKFRDLNTTGFTYISNNQELFKDKVQYQNQDFSDKQPHLMNNFRDRKNFQEVSGLQFKYQPQSNDMRIAQSIQKSAPLTTEPLNTLLISMPKWREYNKAKWSDQKNFNAQKTSRDKTWDPLQNTSPKYNEPYIDKIVEFRQNFHKKKNSLIDTLNTNIQQESHSQNKKHANNVFDPTISKDHTWKERLMQSQSLRQRAHLNTSIKLKDKSINDDLIFDYPALNLSQGKESARDESEPIQSSETPDTKVKHFFKFQQTSIQLQQVSLAKQQKEDLKIQNHQLSQILSESYNTPKHLHQHPNKHNKSPIKLKEQIVNLSAIKPDTAASLLNNTFNKSFTNSWQYQVLQPLQNKKFSAKVELSDSHILHELDKVKTYYGSIVGKLSINTGSTQMTTNTPMMSFDKRDRSEQGKRDIKVHNNPPQILHTPLKVKKNTQDNFYDKNRNSLVQSPNSSIELNLDQIKMKRRYIRSTATSPLNSTYQNGFMNIGGRDFNNATSQYQQSQNGANKSTILDGDPKSIKDAINKYFNKIEKNKKQDQ